MLVFHDGPSGWVSEVCFKWREVCLLSWCNRKHDGRVNQRYGFESRRGQWALFSLIPSALSFVFLWHTNTHTHTHTHTHTRYRFKSRPGEWNFCHSCCQLYLSPLSLSLSLSLSFCKDGSDWLMKRASCSCCNFLCVVHAATNLKYRRYRLSCLPFVWHFLSLWHTHSQHTHTHTHTHTRTHTHTHTQHTHTHTHTHTQPSAVKLVLWHHWIHGIQVHPVTPENQ